MELDSLMELYLDQVGMLVDAEKRTLKVLPRMIEAASAGELRDAFEHFQERTRTHISRLQTIVNQLDRPLDSKATAMQALIEEAEEVVKSPGDSSVRDAGLICAMQRIGHYQIAVYGCARTFADLLAVSEAADLLLESLEEEERADKELTYLAKGLINIQAAEA